MGHCASQSVANADVYSQGPGLHRDDSAIFVRIIFKSWLTDRWYRKAICENYVSKPVLKTGRPLSVLRKEACFSWCAVQSVLAFHTGSDDVGEIG